ncbi:MAG: site-2 protease family protein [Thermodesulfobacteriota bacterium]
MKLFRILGIQISLNYTWFIVFGLITWSLASGYFPYHYPGLSRSAHWIMGFLGAVFLFLSVLAHEVTHSYIAKKEGMDVSEITLFIFGGVSQLTKEPEDPLKELKVAIGGPASSVVLALIFWILSKATSPFPDLLLYTGLLNYLAFINLSLGVFNLIPGFPLDGGRVLRAIYWRKTNNLRRATQIASGAGKWVGVGIILLGLFWILTGNVIGGFWFVIIGIFLRSAAEGGYQQAMLKGALEGVKVKELMSRGVISVQPSIRIDRLVEDFYLTHKHDTYPVIDGDRIIGIVTLKLVREVPRDQWKEKTVRDVMMPAAKEIVVDPDGEATDALEKMVRSGEGRLPVVKDGKAVGMITRRDILHLLQIKTDLSK